VTGMRKSMKANYIYIIFKILTSFWGREPTSWSVFFIDIFISLGLVYAEYIVPRKIYEKNKKKRKAKKSELVSYSLSGRSRSNNKFWWFVPTPVRQNVKFLGTHQQFDTFHTSMPKTKSLSPPKKSIRYCRNAEVNVICIFRIVLI